MKGKWYNAFSGRQLHTVRQETQKVSVMAQHLEADARLKGQKGSRLLPHLIRRQGPTVKKFQAKEKEVLRTTEGEFRAVKDIVQTRREIIGILPCVKITSPKEDA